MIIYIITMVGGGNLSKIGFSTSLKNRLSMIQTHNPYPIHQTLLLKSKKYKEIEMELHKEFKRRGKWVRGEWFALGEEDWEWVVDNCRDFLYLYNPPPIAPKLPEMVVELQKKLIDQQEANLSVLDVVLTTNLQLNQQLRQIKKKMDRMRRWVWREVGR